MEGNDLLETLLLPHADRFSGYIVFNPFYAAEILPRLDGWLDGPVYSGLKTLCDYWKIPITDKRFEPMWDYADRRFLPVLSHTWTGAYSSPAMFAGLAPRYPNVQFILGHTGGTDQGRAEAEALAAEHPNIYLEWCGSIPSARRWEETLRTVSLRQVVFGTDAMAHDVNWELGRLLSLEVPDGTLEPILGGNMRRILGMRKRR